MIYEGSNEKLDMLMEAASTPIMERCGATNFSGLVFHICMVMTVNTPVRPCLKAETDLQWIKDHGELFAREV